MLSGFGCALVPEIEEAAAAVACFGIIIRLEVQLSRLYSSVLPGTDEATPAVHCGYSGIRGAYILAELKD